MSAGIRVFLPELLYRDGELRPHQALAVDLSGTILDVGEACELRDRGAPVPLPDRALLPGFVDAHSHCWQVMLRGVEEEPADFSDWVARQLYPVVDGLDPPLFRLAARLCFLQMLRAGITTCGEFHYVHRGPGGADAADAYDLSVLEEAERVGLRLALCRTMYDQGTREGQKRFLETPDQACEALRRLAPRVDGHPTLSLLPAPHSLHGASAEMLQAAGELARERDTRFHIHLAEQQADLPFAQERHGTSPLRVLEDLGLLDHRTVLVHGIWLDPDEVRLLGEAGGGLVYNPGTNMLLGDGTAPLPLYLEAGVQVGLGTDANALPDLLEELRRAEYLQRILQLRMNVLPAAAGSPGAFLELATRGGARCLGLETGAIEAGRPADLVSWRLDSPGFQPARGVSPAAVLQSLVHGVSAFEAVDRVWVQGQLVVDGGAPCRASLPLTGAELSEALRARRSSAR